MAVPPVYLDECVDQHLAIRLEQRRFTVITPQSQNATGLSDGEQLTLAVINHWILLSHNAKHFRRWHHEFLQRSRLHSGIITLPQSGLVRTELRAAMMLDWIDGGKSIASEYLRWSDLQSQLDRGFRLPRYDEAETHFVCGRIPPGP
jgi:hypothetical protein